MQNSLLARHQKLRHLCILRIAPFSSIGSKIDWKEKQAENTYEFRAVRKDGSIIWLEAFATLIEYNGKPAVQSMFLNIDKRKKAEEALKKSEEEYISLFANMMDGFAYCQMIFDEANKPVDFVYLQINDAFERITGLKRSLVGKG